MAPEVSLCQKTLLCDVPSHPFATFNRQASQDFGARETNPHSPRDAQVAPNSGNKWGESSRLRGELGTTGKREARDMSPRDGAVVPSRAKGGERFRGLGGELGHILAQMHKSLRKC